MSKIGAPSKVRPFHFWSQKVLPLVYDDSLSYYEVLSKLTSKVNEVINVVNDELVDYIREQLDNLYIDASYISATETLVLSLKEGTNE